MLYYYYYFDPTEAQNTHTVPGYPSRPNSGFSDSVLWTTTFGPISGTPRLDPTLGLVLVRIWCDACSIGGKGVQGLATVIYGLWADQ